MTTLMHREAAEAGEAVARFLATNAPTLRQLGEDLRHTPPALIITCARGSSDHAATYGKYVLEAYGRVPVASAALSVVSVLDRPPVDLSHALLIAISQSGRSPDLLTSVEAHQKAGARVVALVNDETSPLAGLADVTLPLCAGPELSVAATKSCLASMVGLLAIASAWSQDEELAREMANLPAALTQAFALDWSPAVPLLADVASAYVIGRGFAHGVAQEMALKMKETCALHAESFSSAEVRHGPMAIVHSDFPVLALATSDKAGLSTREIAETLRARGARMLLADALETGDLPARSGHQAIEPLLMLASFYRMANALSLAKGLDPDKPQFLSKVTQTI